jgi:hypothetical protein
VSVGSQPTFMRCAQLLRLLCLTLRCHTGTVSIYSIWRLIVRSYNTLLLKVETGLCSGTGLPLFFLFFFLSFEFEAKHREEVEPKTNTCKLFV